MENINVSEIMNEHEHENEHRDTVKGVEERMSMVSTWGASAKDASERLFALNKLLNSFRMPLTLLTLPAHRANGRIPTATLQKHFLSVSEKKKL